MLGGNGTAGSGIRHVSSVPSLHAQPAAGWRSEIYSRTDSTQPSSTQINVPPPPIRDDGRAALPRRVRPSSAFQFPSLHCVYACGIHIVYENLGGRCLCSAFAVFWDICVLLRSAEGCVQVLLRSAFCLRSGSPAFCVLCVLKSCVPFVLGSAVF